MSATPKDSIGLKELTFGTFDFRAVDDPEYKEDSVREDIIAPLLRRIGYSPNASPKMVRSRPLRHPYVMFGAQKRNLTIIPDYILETNGKPCFVLDAKSPSENVVTGNNVAQVYSYAIHPEIRAWNYGLCNGRQLSLFQVTSIEPKQVYDLTKLNDALLLDINQKLNPRTITESEVLDYRLDGGAYLHFVMNLPLSMELHFPDVPIPHLAMMGADSYCMNVVTKGMAERDLAFTFDFDKKLLRKLLKQFTADVQSKIMNSLKSHPFVYRNNITPPHARHIQCRLPTKPQFSRSGEMFFPLIVTDFL